MQTPERLTERLAAIRDQIESLIDDQNGIENAAGHPVARHRGNELRKALAAVNAAGHD